MMVVRKPGVKSEAAVMRSKISGIESRMSVKRINA